MGDSGSCQNKLSFKKGTASPPGIRQPKPTTSSPQPASPLTTEGGLRTPTSGSTAPILSPARPLLEAYPVKLDAWLALLGCPPSGAMPPTLPLFPNSLGALKDNVSPLSERNFPRLGGESPLVARQLIPKDLSPYASTLRQSPLAVCAQSHPPSNPYLPPPPGGCWTRINETGNE